MRGQRSPRRTVNLTVPQEVVLPHHSQNPLFVDGPEHRDVRGSPNETIAQHGCADVSPQIRWGCLRFSGRPRETTPNSSEHLVAFLNSRTSPPTSLFSPVFACSRQASFSVCCCTSKALVVGNIILHDQSKARHLETCTNGWVKRPEVCRYIGPLIANPDLPVKANPCQPRYGDAVSECSAGNHSKN